MVAFVTMLGIIVGLLIITTCRIGEFVTIITHVLGRLVATILAVKIIIWLDCITGIITLPTTLAELAMCGLASSLVQSLANVVSVESITRPIIAMLTNS